jgi:hypothetical protein
LPPDAGADSSVPDDGSASLPDAGVTDGESEGSPFGTDGPETEGETVPTDSYCDPTTTSCLPTDILIDANNNIICNPHEEDCSQYLEGG